MVKALFKYHYVKDVMNLALLHRNSYFCVTNLRPSQRQFGVYEVMAVSP